MTVGARYQCEKFQQLDVKRIAKLATALPPLMMLRAAPAPAARECAALHSAAAPCQPKNRPQDQCASHRSASPRPPYGNAHTMRSNAQQAATRQSRDPASCCALAEPRRITRHCMRLPPSRRVAATFGPRLTLPRGGLRPQGRQAPPALKHESRQRPTAAARAAVMPHAPAHGASQTRPQPPAQCARRWAASPASRSARPGTPRRQPACL